MQRNKVIYALSDAALVVTSDLEKGGTWTGAVEQLEKYRMVPVFIRNGPAASKENGACCREAGSNGPSPATPTLLRLRSHKLRSS